MSEKKIEIWGVCPPPIGGISIYCKRLIEYMYSIDKSVSMLNFASSKTNLSYIKDIKYPLWEFFKLPFKSERIIHVQLRNVYFLSLLYLFGWKHSIIITLHNRKMLLLKGWQKKIMALFLKRVKYIIYNDPTYTEELLSIYSIDREKIVILPTYMPPSENEKRGLTPDIENFISSHKFTISTNANILVQNVWGDLYGFDQLIELMDRLVNKQKIDVGLIFLFAQIGDEKYFSQCKQLIKELNLEDNFLIVINSKVNGFEVWEKTDLFIRATMSDMEGISVKEALQFGTPVIASDVCSRPHEAMLYCAGNVDELFEKVIEILGKKDNISYMPDVDVPKRIYEIYRSIL